MSEETEFPKETVTRQDTARREIVTAIDLVLGGGDAVSANVLTWAALEVLRGVATARGIETLTAELEDRIKPQAIKMWRELQKGHYNYFKHADRDTDRVVDDFRPEATTWALHSACIDYSRIYETYTWSMIVYKIWFLCRYPDIAMDSGQELVGVSARSLGYPEGKPLVEAIKPAWEMIKTGRANPWVLDKLPGAWRSKLEPE